MAETPVKRKRPPTFQHLPLKRAKKLKQIWVANAKIKSKWKAQKRKEAALAGPSHPTVQDEGNNDSDGSDNNESAEQESENQGEDEDERPQKSTLHPSRAHIHPELKLKLASKPRRDNKVEKEPPAPSPSLRDLTREAYSRSSLHTFKSDPFNRRGGSRTRGRGGGRGAPRGERGRGQPNMKLRMDAMLEKIKRDLT